MFPTQEQVKAVEEFGYMESLKLNAFAGTGKTSTLRLMAESTFRRGKYLAFNRAIANHAAQSFPSTVEAVTSHSLAYRTILQRGFDRDQMVEHLNANAIANIMRLPRLSYGDGRSISPAGFGFLVAQTIRAFAYSEFESISSDMVPFPGYLEYLNPFAKAHIKSEVSQKASQMWSAMINPRNKRFPLGHDGYFKLWSLSKPNINTDFILLDEAQDSNPALLSVLRSQRAQIIYVGDRFQQIYEWRGAINAMESIATQKTSSLTQSFRFGESIADFATKIINLLDKSAIIYGSPEIKSTLGCAKPNAILSRTNASLIGYLMRTLEVGYCPFIIGGVAELQWMLKDVVILKSGSPGTHPEFFGFNNWHEVEEFISQPEGANLITFVNIVNRYGENLILHALSQTANDSTYSNISLSTTHKAKGLEWDSVFLADDFPEPQRVTSDNEKSLRAKGCIIVLAKDGHKYAFMPEEIRILYVAATRGKIAVRIPQWCVTFFGVTQNEYPLNIELEQTKLSISKNYDYDVVTKTNGSGVNENELKDLLQENTSSTVWWKFWK